MFVVPIMRVGDDMMSDNRRGCILVVLFVRLLGLVR